MVCGVGCATKNAHTLRIPRDIRIEGNKIYVDCELYAELVFVYGDANRCRGTAIHYIPIDCSGPTREDIEWFGLHNRFVF